MSGPKTNDIKDYKKYLNRRKNDCIEHFFPDDKELNVFGYKGA